MRGIAISVLLAACAGLARAADPAAEALEGAWLVSVADDPRERFLFVSGARSEQGEVRVERAVHGWLHIGDKPVSEWKALIAGDEIRLSYVTASDSRVAAAIRSGDTTAAGTITYRNGKRHELRLVRLPDDELHALREAARSKRAQRQRPAVAADSKIYLVYVGAPDCPSCLRFEGEYGRSGQDIGRYMPELAEAKFVKAALWSYRDPLFPSALPEELRWLVEPDVQGRRALRKYGTPFFAAVVDRRVLAQGHGLGALQSLVAPQVRLAVEARRAAR